MDAEEFIRIVKKDVCDAAVIDTISLLECPPGRRPPEYLKEMASWYHSLEGEQRRVLTAVIKEAVHSSIFGLLCVIDGVRLVDGGIKGSFELLYKSEREKEVLINMPDVPLHDLFNAVDVRE